ncbi:MAG TPA: LapA family protein [Candidatus Saccharimonadales bacterium]|nr:LapA family protein [Candidatus Saccharimonadales bacterium]
MFSLIVAILFALEMAYFATQNTGSVALRFVNYEIVGVPMYVVVISSILAGVILSWIISLFSSATYFLNMRSKEHVILQDRKAILDLKKRMVELEAENARLKDRRTAIVEKKHEDRVDDIGYKPSFFERFIPSSTRHYSKQV